MTFHVKLIKLRKGQGHTQSTFAEAVGVSRQSVYKWETGQSYPDVEKLLKIARLFGVTVDELIDDALPCRFTDKAPVEAPAEAVAAEEKPAEAEKAEEKAEEAPEASEAPAAEEKKTEEKKPSGMGRFFGALFGRKK
ncbi:MAG: helix-turn-helix transcriptional regulator [Clostridia bacterium]|nr:helix-turn-helix transcriptional regulator [Clostridia bacterium]